MSSGNHFDVIVVGGGISGLTAAYTLKKRNKELSVLVLEAKDRVGGRTHSLPLVTASGTDRYDLGGQWVSRVQTHVTRLVKELNLKPYPQYIDGKKLLQVDGRKIRSYTGEIPNLSILTLIDIKLFIWRSENLRKQICVHHPYSHPKARKWDSLSLEAYLDKVLLTKVAKGSIAAAVRSIYGCELNQISFLYHLLYVEMAGGLETLFEAVDNTAQEARLDGGAQGISLEMSKRIGSDRIKLNQGVSSIDQTDAEVVVTTESGWKGRASKVIIAMPPKAIDRIKFNPRLPEDRVDFMRNMPMGNVIKVLITYEKAFWRNNGLSGEAVSDNGMLLKDFSPSLPVSIIFDGTSDNNNPALVCFLVGHPAVEWSLRPAKERQQAVIDHLIEFFGREVTTFLDYIEKDWSREPYSWGGPVSYVNVGNVKHFSQAIRRPDGRIHYAGTETATVWSGYMSGAIQAGERAAFEILSYLKPESLSEDDHTVLKEHSLDSKNCPECKSKKKKKGSSYFLLFGGFMLLSASAFFIHKAITDWY